MSDCESGDFSERYLSCEDKLNAEKHLAAKAIKSFLNDAWGESPLNEDGILEVIELIVSGKIPHLKFEVEK